MAGLRLRHAGTRPGGTQRTGAAVEKTRGAQPQWIDPWIHGGSGWLMVGYWVI